MLSTEDDGDYPTPTSSPSASSIAYSCDEAGSDLDRYCSANSVLERSSFSSSTGYHAADFFDDAFPSLSLHSNSNSNLPSPTLRPSHAAEDSISISGDDCSDPGAHSDDDDDSPRSLHGLNGWNQNLNQNRSSGVGRGSERRSSILMDSSVAFGSDDWDEFMLERGDGSGESAPVYLFEMESIHSKEQIKLSGDEPGCKEGEVNQETVQLSEVKGKEPVSSAEHPQLESSSGKSGFNAGEENHLDVAKEHESNGNSSSESMEKREEAVKELEGLESFKKKSGGKEIEEEHPILATGGKDAESEIELKGIDQVNQIGGTDNLLDDMVLEMEDILLNSESHSPRSNTDNRYKNHATDLLAHHSREGSSTASTSGADDSYGSIRNPESIDSVELIGAKQKKGDVSFGERLVGVKEYTVYIFKVRSGADCWQVERRYRDFYTLYRQLKALFTAHGLTLPLPWSHVESESKKVFGNSSPTVIADRSVLLQECLSSLLSSRYSFRTPTPLLFFLSPGKIPLASQIPPHSQGKNLIPSDSMGKKISLVVEVRAHKSVRQLLELQHHTCAGCHQPLDSESTFLRGLAQTVGWSRNFRFCEYTGQLFCTACHVNDTAVIPGRVLHGWDFTLYPVSQLAKAYLESINDQPMLCVSAVNPFLFSKVPALLHIMGLRKKIAAMLPYITCPFRKSVEKGLGARRYLLECNDFFALRDLVDLSKGVFAGFPVMVERLHKKIEEHITQQCLVCYDAGVPCAARNSCHDPLSLIFPFQETEAQKCSSCGSIFHADCFMMLNGCACKKTGVGKVDKRVGPAHQSDGLVNRLSVPSSQSTSGFFSDIISKATSDKIWRPKNRSPVILMGSLPGGTSL
ncbi:hypothetical protein LUZ61_020794 [Rhynchospora tenuis]|uniref:PX domain-containing protein n=1 Tax=Rhynchospora tenuis TaxID=198213 RepID=A0AAD5ZDN8_9POAL|nr:hypothetical protein LUZ61_020794 [Rhynchospora tenuis]